MNQHLHLSRVINLISEDSQRFWTTDESDAWRRQLASDMDGVRSVGRCVDCHMPLQPSQILVATAVSSPLAHYRR
jgi:hypothetical protein